MSRLTLNQQKAFNKSLNLGSQVGTWADEMERNNSVKGDAERERRLGLTPEQRASENAVAAAAKVARNAIESHPAVVTARFAAPMALASVRRPVAASSAWRPPAGKTMRECRNSNVTHAHASGAACKYVHKNENSYGHLRANQKRPAGGKTTRKTNRKASRKASGGGNIKIVASPPPLSKVDTYTSWPGGIDPTVRLYNQRTMLGGR